MTMFSLPAASLYLIPFCICLPRAAQDQIISRSVLFKVPQENLSILQAFISIRFPRRDQDSLKSIRNVGSRIECTLVKGVLPYSLDTILPPMQVFIHSSHDQSGTLFLNKMKSKLSDVMVKAVQNRTPTFHIDSNQEDQCFLTHILRSSSDQ